MTTLTSNKLFASLTDGDLDFTDISVAETDVFSGTSGVTSFTANSGNPADYLAGAETGMSWSGVALEAYADAAGDPSSQTLTFSYDVAVSSTSEFITAIDSSYAIDLLLGNGQLVAVESIYDTNGDLLGTQTYSSESAAPAPNQLSMGVQNAVVSLQLTLTASSPNADVEASIISQAFAQTAGAALASIGDTVWLDSNGNGLQDTGETGVAGVTVDLLNAAGTSVIAVTTTNASGFYQFTGLLPGSYEVRFVAPAGDGFTAEGVGGNAAINSSANQTTGITAPVTLTAGETDNDVNAGLLPPPTAGIGDYVWLDSNANGLQDTGELGVAGVTVDLLNAAGTSVLATTTTNASGWYYFGGLAAGSYEVKFVAPSGDQFTVAGVGSNPALNSSANPTTGITAPITLTAGEIDDNVDAGLVASTSGATLTTGITVNKIPGSMVVNACGQETYTIAVTNTGNSAVTNLVLTDNIGTAAKPDDVTPTLTTPGFNGSLAAGATVDYSVTIDQIGDRGSGCGTISHTCSGGDLAAGDTAWFNCSFTPTSTANGTCYVFKGVQCQLSGGAAGGFTVDCPDAEVTFSSSCKQASTVYDASTNCWVTTLPANCNPGNVFLTGCPVTVPAGADFNGATCTWSIADSGNNCGSGSVNWTASCQGYSSFDQNGLNGSTNYNDIGVKVCDNTVTTGGGSDGAGNFGGGSEWGQAQSAGSGNDGAGTPESEYTVGNCGSSAGGGNNACGNNDSGGSGGCGGSANDNGGCGSGDDGGGAVNTAGCGSSGSGTCAETQVGASAVADTVTVTGTAGGTTVTGSDTAEVIVLGSPNNVSVSGATPTGSLTSLYGKAQTLEFTYNAGNTVATRTVSIGASTGSNSNAMAFIAISNNANPNASGAQIYFEGTVANGQKLYADASTNSLTNTPNTGAAAYMSTVAGHGIFADIYSSQAAFLAGAAPVQVDTYNTSGSQAMHLNDEVGSLTLVGYVGSTGGHLTS